VGGRKMTWRDQQEWEFILGGCLSKYRRRWSSWCLSTPSQANPVGGDRWLAPSRLTRTPPWLTSRHIAEKPTDTDRSLQELADRHIGPR